MSDLLIDLNRKPVLGSLIRALGLPNPPVLARASGAYEEQPFLGKSCVLLRIAGGYASERLAEALSRGGAAAEEDRIDVLVLDATACRGSGGLRALYDGLHTMLPRLGRNARVLVAAAPPSAASDVVAAAAARGVEGFVRSLAKELGRRGATANLAYVEADAADRLEGVVRFFCGPQSAYVTGQAVRVSAAARAARAQPLTDTLAGKTALVTGAARGIGLAIAERLAQEGAHVVSVDVAPAEEELRAACTRLGGTPLVMDISGEDAPARLAAYLRDTRGGVDVVVHNAGITRDRSLAKMSEREWEAVIAINFSAPAAIDAALIGGGVLRDEGRIVCLSSISGIAGNFGQANYAASKAALIGYVAAQAPRLAARGIAINAVAPGFIETAMTRKIPFMTREFGRRLNSLQQGGTPRDVAELVTFLSTPAACGISGQTIRVCGQAMLGA
ncbi:MAG TPA: 3-oxoacyl-ACP reductase [Telluria sp.]|nr:3-oxoacyl-ACP reductase [Telluria sp.]